MVHVSAHMHVSPSIGMKNAYVKSVCVGRRWAPDCACPELTCRYAPSNNVSG